MTQDTETPNNEAPATSRPTRSARLPMILGAVAVGIVIGYAAVYGIGGAKRNQAAGTSPCLAAVTEAKRLAPLAHGEVAAVTMASSPLQVPDITFEDASGKQRKLSEWRGRTVLLNLWATWCVPCRKEMPALDALQGKLGSPKFEVVAVNIDTRDPDRPRNFMKDENLTRLGFFTDQNARSFQELKSVGRALGMPTSVLVDPNGCEIGTIAGPAEWASDDAIKLISTALDRPAGT